MFETQKARKYRIKKEKNRKSSPLLANVVSINVTKEKGHKTEKGLVN